VKRNRIPILVLDPVRESLVSSAGGVLLRQTIRASGLERSLSRALASWRSPRAVHDPGKVLVDLATAVALGGDCAADLAVVRAQPGLFGPVASDPTVSRLIAALAADIDIALAAIRAARAQARAAVWARRRPLAGRPGCRDGGQVIVDLDSTLVTAHSDKERAGPTFKKTFGFAPMCAFVDHGEHGTGEPLALDLRPGTASPHASGDHIATLDAALAQLPEHERGQVLVRADTGACSKAFLHHVTDAGLEYSIGFPALETVKEAVEAIPAQAWRVAVDGDGVQRDGAQVAELTAWMPVPTKPTRSPVRFGPQHWPEGMRVIARRERPHPGAQLRLTDHDGWRITCLATNTRGPGWTLAALEVRHRQRARAEDRIRGLKDTGMRNLPFHGYAQNQIWLEIVALAAELLAWTQTLAWDDHEPARRWEPKRLRLRIMAVAGRIIRTGRRRWLRLPRGWPWNRLIDTAWTALSTA
jgi:Transposase DDE domain group 1